MTHILLCGCGKMGQALLGGWLAAGTDITAITVIDPAIAKIPNLPQAKHINYLPSLPAQTGTAAMDMIVLATKPQDIATAVAGVMGAGGSHNAPWLSIAAGVTIAGLQQHIGKPAAILRAMPNTPAAIGLGITALAWGDGVGADAQSLARQLLAATGHVVLVDESLMDAITAVSGSGPAYVYALQEAMEAAAIDLGLEADLARRLTIATVRGAGAMMASTDAPPPATLRQHISSPGGTTLAGLAVLAGDDKNAGKNGLADLMGRAIRAAFKRSQELGKDGA